MQGTNACAFGFGLNESSSIWESLRAAKESCDINEGRGAVDHTLRKASGRATPTGNHSLYGDASPGPVNDNLTAS